MPDLDDDRYSRNLGLLGSEGQKRLQNVSVAVIGAGGLGSHVLQQLAYLGTRMFLVIDPDVIELSNLNRLIGATPADLGKRKIDVAERMVREILPGATVDARAVSVQSDEVLPILARSDCIIGCVDNDSARLHLTKIASTHRIPYFDLASDAGADAGSLWFGGRVFASINGDQCLSCAGELDQHALALAAMDPEQREVHRRIYGIDRSVLDDTGPMVVSVNGVVASLAVTEFIAWAARLRPPRPHLVYRGDLGTVTVRTDKRVGSCYYCDGLWRGDA